MRVVGDLVLSKDVFRLFEAELAWYELVVGLGCPDRTDFSLLNRVFMTEYNPDWVGKWSSYIGLMLHDQGVQTTFKQELSDRHDHLIEVKDNVSAHLIYPFKGRMIPRTASALLNIVLGPPDGKPKTILDPMCGSGTVLVEAILKGGDRIGEIYGVELVPYYAYIAEAKTQAALGYRPEVLSKEEVDRYTVDWEDGNKITNVVMAYGQFLSERTRRSKVAKRLQLIDEAITITQELKQKWDIKPPIHVEILGGYSATQLPFGPECIDGIVFSPPYSLALNYQEVNPIPKDFPRHHSRTHQVDGADLDTYRLLMTQVYRECYRVLRKGGRAAIIIGNQTKRGQVIDNVGWSINILNKIGFNIMLVIAEDIMKAMRIGKDYIIIVEKPRSSDEYIEYQGRWSREGGVIEIDGGKLEQHLE